MEDQNVTSFNQKWAAFLSKGGRKPAQSPAPEVHSLQVDTRTKAERIAAMRKRIA